MSDSDPKGPNDSGDEPPGDSQPSGAGGGGDVAPNQADAPKRSKKRRRLRDIAKEELQGTGRLMAGRTKETIRAVFDGRGVEEHSVDAETFNDSATGVTRLFTTMNGSRPRYTAFGWGSSVWVDIAASEEELDRAETAWAEYERTKSNRKRESLARLAIPDTILAALATEDLLAASSEDVLSAALSYGTEVTDAFKALVRTLAEEEISMKIEIPQEPEEEAAERSTRQRELSSGTAQQYKDALQAAGSQETILITAVGVLTMADSARRQVRLTLDSKATNDPALGARRTAITARYTLKAHDAIKKDNLWDQHVIATFEMTRDKTGTTAQKRAPSFVLISARLRYE